MPVREPPSISSGAVCFSPRPAIFAPILRSGSTMRFMGRPESEASPMRRLLKGCPARTPASRRMAVPELPQSIGSSGGLSLPSVPCTMRRVLDSTSITQPIACKARMVQTQSSPGRKPVITVMPSASAEKRTARCERLLSPGTESSPPMWRTWRTVRVEAGARLMGVS